MNIKKTNKQNALKTTLSYQKEQSISINAIEYQLLFEGFTDDETAYAITNLK